MGERIILCHYKHALYVNINLIIMKKVHSLLLLTLLGFLFSCSKNDEEPVVPETSNNPLLGKWDIVSITQIERNGPGVLVVPGIPGDYWNFTTDSIFANMGGTLTNIKYRMLADDTTMLYYMSASTIPTDTFFIRTLTQHSLVLRGRADQANNIGIITLKK